MIRALSGAVVLGAIAVCWAPAAVADYYDQLRSLLPAGYGSGSCAPAEPGFVAPGDVAALTCRANSRPGGPGYARYELFQDPAMLAVQFQRDVSARHPYPVPCPGGQPSPGHWMYESTPDTTAGSILCGRVEGGDDVAVEWTKDRELLLALASGPDLTGLYDWWRTNR